jgi:hypothetical protein
MQPTTFRVDEHRLGHGHGERAVGQRDVERLTDPAPAVLEQC